jgi:hypothetical protein
MQCVVVYGVVVYGVVVYGVVVYGVVVYGVVVYGVVVYGVLVYLRDRLRDLLRDLLRLRVQPPDRLRERDFLRLADFCFFRAPPFIRFLTFCAGSNAFGFTTSLFAADGSNTSPTDTSPVGISPVDISLSPIFYKYLYAARI